MIIRDSYLEILQKMKDLNVIKVVTGVRRSGKSTILEQYRDWLISVGIPERNVIAFNFEEEENRALREDGHLLHETIMNLIEKGTKNYVFLDEIQLVDGFERIVDSLYVKKDIDLYITGSNSDISSSRLGTWLTGRYVEIKMQPLTFSEFTQFFPEERSRSELFDLFIKYGGFPEVANFLVAGVGERTWLYLDGLYKTIIEKDIKKKSDLRMEDFRNVTNFVLDNIGNVTSPSSIAGTLTERQRRVDNETVTSYLDDLMDCYVLYGVDRYDIRGKVLLKTLKKYYAVDLGLANVVLGKSADRDTGHKLENIVFLELNKRYGQVWIGKNYDKEIDFVVRNRDGETEYFQVAETATGDTLTREKSSLDNTGDDYRKTILTMDSVETDEGGIARRNLLKWLNVEKF